mmetsp:Transcript_38151/g.109474  ORF Transcript_38151/g.109474 Transcript_38151/m.109474 type:complete len:299 (+) Transcript_38151:868-1764(+)
MALQVYEGVLQRRADVVDVDRAVHGADFLREILGPAPRLVAAVLRGHVASDEEFAGEVVGVLGGEGGHPSDLPDVGEDLLLAALRARRQLLDGALAHDRNQRSRGRRVRTPGQRQKVAAHAGATEVVPEPTRRPVGDLLHGVVDPWLERRRGRERHRVLGAEAEVDVLAVDGGRRGGLVGAGDEGGAHGADVRQVHDGDDDLDLVEGAELRALCHAISVDVDHRTTVEVHAASIASLHVGVEVHTAALLRGAAHEVDTRVELPQLVVAARTVRDDLHAVQGQSDVRRVRREELLARLE